jgi:hypothetical protein
VQASGGIAPLLPLPDRIAGRFPDLTTADVGPRLEQIDRLTGTAEAAGSGPDLLGVLAAQVVAHISDGAPARRCAHEPCGRWFSRQQGRAQYGQHRSRWRPLLLAGCARAAAQRGYRQCRRAAHDAKQRS